MDNITFNYIDIANKKLKIAKNFSVNYFGNCIPKNAIYGHITKNLYVYVNDFSQFKPTYKRTRFDIYVLDQRKDIRFHKETVSKHTEWYNLFFAFIDYNNLYDVKCENVLCINRAGGKPERKQPQTHSGYAYNVPYRHRKTLEWENSFTTERGACETPVAYIDKQKTRKIAEEQKSYKKQAEKHINEYEHKKYVHERYKQRVAAIENK